MLKINKIRSFLTIVLIAVSIQSYSQCAATSTNCDEFISNVVVGSISNNSGACGNYVDYTAQSTNMNIGTGYAITVTNGNPIYAQDQCGIWVDWNQDNDFDDANETIAIIGTPGVGPYTATITPPSGAILGNTTMRIRITYTGAVSSCGTATYGEVEDYTINVQAALAMSYVSSTTTQTNTNDAQRCWNNVEIIGLEVVTSGTVSPFDLTQIRMLTNGSTNVLADVTNIDIYYTGTSSAFSTANLFASAAPAIPGSIIQANGTQTLEAGTNYFWIVYDLNSSATLTNIIDARCSQFTTGVGTFAPTTTNPAGTRTIVACTPSPGGVYSNNTMWLKTNDGSNISYDGSNRVGAWTSSIGSVSASQGTNTNKPIFNSSNEHFNFNPHIEIDGFNDELSNSSSGDLLGSNGTIILVSSFVGITTFAFTGYGNTYQIKTDGNCGHTNTSGSLWQASWATATSVASPNNRPQILGLKGGNTAFNFRNGIYNTTASTTAFGAITHGNLNIGSRGGDEFSGANLSEAITYDRSLSTTELDYIQSYLAIKYGITMGTNGTSTDYYSPNGEVIWDQSANSAYAYDIAGIGEEESAGLYQTKSHSINGGSTTTFNDILTVVNGSDFSSPSNIGTNSSYFVWGNNNGATSMSATTNFNSSNGSSFDFLLGRGWKAQETGTIGTLTLQFDLSSAGITDLSKVGLLVDTDTDFSSGALSVAPSSFNNGTGIVEYTYNFTLANGLFFTLGESASVLDVDLLSFDAKSDGNNTVNVEWITTSEKDNDYFIIQKSKNGEVFEDVVKIDGRGTTNQKEWYQFKDKKPFSGTSYYRLKQVNKDGTINYSYTKTVRLSGIEILTMYPLPANDFIKIILSSSKDNIISVALIDILGKETISTFNAKEGINNFNINTKNLSSGTYVLKITPSNGKNIYQKNNNRIGINFIRFYVLQY